MDTISSTIAVAGLVRVAFLGAAAAACLRERPIRRSEGLEVVYEDQKPEIDIVCVQGLRGDPAKTWTSQKDGESVNWTKELLPNLINPHADGSPRRIRVLSYEYSRELFAGSLQELHTMDTRRLRYLPQALYLHSDRLIEQLVDLRVRDAEKEKRRVIFVAHSLGGLIVKNALVQASAAIGEHHAGLKAIELLTIGVLFFGTPQRDHPRRKWSQLLDDMYPDGTSVPSPRVIRPLVDQEELMNLQIERYKSIESNFFNFSFYEGFQCHSNVHEGVAEPMATKAHTWKKFKLLRPHNDLAKFHNDKDQGFPNVMSCINECLEARNYENAEKRHSKFFDHKNKPRTSNRNPIQAERRAEERWATLEPKLEQMSSRDSKKTVKVNEKTNHRLLNQSEKDNGLADLTTLKIVKKMAYDAVEVGKYKKAEAFSKRLLVSTQEIYTPCSEQVAEVLEIVADVADRRGRLLEATETLRRAREIHLIHFPLEPEKYKRRIVKVTERISHLCKSTDLYDDTSQEIDRVISLFQNQFDVNDDETKRLREIKANLHQKGKEDRNASDDAASNRGSRSKRRRGHRSKQEG